MRSTLAGSDEACAEDDGCTGGNVQRVPRRGLGSHRLGVDGIILAVDHEAMERIFLVARFARTPPQALGVADIVRE